VVVLVVAAMAAGARVGGWAGVMVAAAMVAG
jgi:hypothetical protein